MPAVRTPALVIRSVDVFETSKVLTLFSRDLGKVSALAKGARRLKSPFGSGLDLLSVCDIVVLHKASDALDLLTEAVLVERFDSLRRELPALYAGYHISELLSELTDHHDPHPRLFDAALVTLRHLGEPALRPGRVLRFELERPTPYFLDLCSFAVFYPVYPPLVSQYELPDRLTGRLDIQFGWTKPPIIVSNGPFVVKEWRFRREMRLEKNPHYWNRANIAIDSVSMPSIEDPNAVVLAYRSGAIDWATSCRLGLVGMPVPMSRNCRMPQSATR